MVWENIESFFVTFQGLRQHEAQDYIESGEKGTSAVIIVLNILIDLKGKTEFIQLTKEQKLAMYYNTCLWYCQRTQKMHRAPVYLFSLSPYFSHGLLGDTSDEGSARSPPSEAAATPCLGESSTRLLSKGVLRWSSNNLMRSVLLDGPP